MRRAGACLRIACAAAAAIAVAASPAAAQSPPAPAPQTGAGAAAAHTLFERGNACKAAHDWTCACEMFRASMVLEPHASTMLSIAECHEHEGKVARAWADLKAVSGLTRGLPPPRAQELIAFAEGEIRRIEPRVSWLRLNLREPPPGLTLTRDGLPLPLAALKVPLPIDAGATDIEARALGYRPWRYRVSVSEGERRVIDVVLVPEQPPPPPPPPPGPATLLGGQRIAGLALAGLGAVGLGMAAGFGINTLQLVGDAVETCPPQSCFATKPIVPLLLAARRSQTAAFASLGIGVWLAGVGITLFTIAPRGRAGAPAVSVSAGPSGVVVGGRW